MLRRLRLGPFDEHSAFVTEYVTLRLPSFPAAFDGFRVALLADVHLGPFVRGGYLRRVIDETLRRAPNLVVLAGDMADRCPSDRRRFARLIEPLARAAPTVAVWGNHDYYFRWPGFARRLAAAGVDVLVNRCRLLCRGGEGVALVGLDDLTRGGPDPAAAMATVPTGAFVIAVAHNPDLADVVGSSMTPAGRGPQNAVFRAWFKKRAIWVTVKLPEMTAVSKSRRSWTQLRLAACARKHFLRN